MQQVEQYIYQFLQYVRLFNSYLNREYNVGGFPSYNEAGELFPRNGVFSFDGKKFKYQYHGSGCTLEVDDIIVDYDIDILKENKIRISDWKFNRFIESYTKGKPDVQIDDLDSIFLELVDKGVLERKEPDRFVFFDQ